MLSHPEDPSRESLEVGQAEFQVPSMRSGDTSEERETGNDCTKLCAQHRSSHGFFPATFLERSTAGMVSQHDLLGHLVSNGSAGSEQGAFVDMDRFYPCMGESIRLPANPSPRPGHGVSSRVQRTHGRGWSAGSHHWGSFPMAEWALRATSWIVQDDAGKGPMA